MGNKDLSYAYHAAPPSDQPRDGWKRLEIHKLSEVAPVVKEVEAEMKGLGYPRKDTFAVGLAILEATANAVRHGHHGDSRRTVLLNYHVGSTEILIEVADEGFGFNPYLVPNPMEEDARRASGRGLFLLRVYMTWIRFNQRGNRITLCKRRSADADLSAGSAQPSQTPSSEHSPLKEVLP
jgi:anti-sigma regulatory factor (Ser/Thr protein kinase)